MYICYIDESGDTGALPSPDSPVQPVFVVAAVLVQQNRLFSLTNDFLKLKARFSPRLARRYQHRWDILLREMKGSELRRDVISQRRSESRRAMAFLDEIVGLLESYRARITGRVWVKQLRYRMDGKAVYTSSVQAICASFQRYLETVDDSGMVIADSRTPTQNVPVAHSVFTQKFRAAGDRFNRVIEMPTFGHSVNHVGLQLADLLCSALLFPMAAHAYCLGKITNPIHVQPGYGLLRDRFGSRLRTLQHRYPSPQGRMTGGTTVSDALGHRSGAYLFTDVAAKLDIATSRVVIGVPSPSDIILPNDAPSVVQEDGRPGTMHPGGAT